MSALIQSDSPMPNATQRNIPELNALALRGLVSMFDTKRNLFCYQVHRTRKGFVCDGFSERYSVMALLGLREVQKMGIEVPIDTSSAIAACIGDMRWIRGVGDLGLLLWLVSECAPQRINDVLSQFDPESCFEQMSDARQGRSMELAWFLAGLCRAKVVNQRLPFGDLAVEVYHRLEENRGRSGLFGHVSKSASWVGKLRGSIGSFADQIYPVYALSKFGATFNLEEPLELALECASALCRLQGPLGQWWWLYNAEKGEVVCRYPVYAVEQHGIAPLGLFEVEQATGRSFQRSIDLGLDWIYGSNELGADLRSRSEPLIWRCILPKSAPKKYWDAARGFLQQSDKEVPTDALRVVHESRPFELGLILYSFAKFGLPVIATGA
jgi:hypothetical protein